MFDTVPAANQLEQKYAVPRVAKNQMVVLTHPVVYDVGGILAVITMFVNPKICSELKHSFGVRFMFSFLKFSHFRPRFSELSSKLGCDCKLKMKIRETFRTEGLWISCLISPRDFLFQLDQTLVAQKQRARVQRRSKRPPIREGPGRWLVILQHGCAKKHLPPMCQTRGERCSLPLGREQTQQEGSTP